MQRSTLCPLHLGLSRQKRTYVRSRIRIARFDFDVIEIGQFHVASCAVFSYNSESVL